MAHDHSMSMQGMFGSYPMTREASGTSWQPDSSPHSGVMGMAGDWQTMVHGFVDAIYDHQGGPRGDDKSFSASMLMLMAQRPVANGTLGLRGMFSLDPLMGNAGSSMRVCRENPPSVRPRSCIASRAWTIPKRRSPIIGSIPPTSRMAS
jgi:hypothetical protein